MPSKAVVDAVEDYLTANWSGAPVVGANLGGEASSDGSAFVVVQYPLANEERMALGRRFRETGAIRFVVNIPKGGGLGPGLTITDALADLFRARRIGPVRTEAPSPPVVDDASDRGNWCQLSFAVPYTRDFEAPT